MPDQNENIFQLITSGYPHFTVSEKKVADYVLSHKNGVLYMSISDLAEECQVGEATLTRFCKRLKLKGYSDFKLVLAQASMHRQLNLTAPEPEELTGDIVEMSRQLLNTHAAVLEQTFRMVSPEAVGKAADLLEKADHVYCMGQGGSMILAMEAAHLMSAISTSFVPVADSHLQVSTAAMMTERDVILFFSYSGATKEILDTFSIAKKHGGKIILITRFLRSPGANLADVVLQCGSDESPLQLGSVSAKIAQLYVADILYSEMCRRDPEKNRRFRKEIAGALAEKHI